jgi:hypothetical protein
MAMRASQALFAVIVLVAACFSVRTLGLSAAQDGPSPDPEEFQFVEDTSRWVMVIQEDRKSIGKLDAAGNLIFPNKGYFRAYRRGQALSSIPPGILINSAQKGVYEFRSGRLIPGDIDDKGRFIPTVGGRIIDFKDYHYSPKAPRIYNLPGYFVRKDKKDGKK